MPRYRFTVTYETDGGSFDTWDEGFEVQSGSDTFGSWDAYTGVLNSGDEVQFINSTTRETDLRSISGFTNNSDIIAGSVYIGYATTRTIANGVSTIQFTMHPTDHPTTPKTKVYSVVTATSTIIPLGITSGAIDMNTLRNFFGEPSWGSSMISMSDLFRGGNLVPDRTANSAVPTSGSISMNDFYGCETELVIEKHPTLKSYFGGFGGGAGTAVLTWNIATAPNSQSDIDVGYKALKSVCEYRWVINTTNTSGAPLYPQIIYNGSTTNNPSMPHTTVWSGDPTLTIEVDYGVQTGSIAGTAYFEVRKIWNGTTYSETSQSAIWEVVIETAGE